jgi:NAD(P)-dependent dehydrogenase (short-subunit alcohol dehydrogenase family)
MTTQVLEERGGADAVLPADVVPLQRFGNTQEMGGTMLYLASRAGGYLSGSTILIDGGRLGNFPSTN